MRVADRQGQAIGGARRRYIADPPPADFRVNVNPFVIWIWIGGAIAVGGALFALWPAPAARRRRVSDVQAARLARELGRAEASRSAAPRLPSAHGYCPRVPARRSRWFVEVAASPRRGAAGDRDEGEDPPLPTSRRARRPSTARSATPSSTARRESSRTTIGRQDAELRAEAIEILAEARPTPRRDAATVYTAAPMESFSASSRSRSRSS